MVRNRLYCGDNLAILATMEKESVDLMCKLAKTGYANGASQEID